MISRASVVQRFLDLQESPSYLEIGVNQGETFLAVRAKRKVAVDPKFLFDTLIPNDGLTLVDFHEVPSDEYFGLIVSQTDRFDVIYLDGLHVFEQTLRDLLNAVVLLKPHGVIVVDDVVPSSYAAALPSLRDFTIVRNELQAINPSIPPEASWMGDIYKIPFFINSFLQQFSHALVKENHGQTVIWREARKSIVERSVESVARMEYKEMLLDRASMNPMAIDQIVERVRAARLTA